jgi:hypothetical protein
LYTVISHTALFFFLVIIASIFAEHYTGNILYKGNQFNTKVDYFLGVDRDWIECKGRQLWIEIVLFHAMIFFIIIIPLFGSFRLGMFYYNANFLR